MSTTPLIDGETGVFTNDNYIGFIKPHDAKDDVWYGYNVIKNFDDDYTYSNVNPNIIQYELSNKNLQLISTTDSSIYESSLPSEWYPNRNTIVSKRMIQNLKWEKNQGFIIANSDYRHVKYKPNFLEAFIDPKTIVPILVEELPNAGLYITTQSKVDIFSTFFESITINDGKPVVKFKSGNKTNFKYDTRLVTFDKENSTAYSSDAIYINTDSPVFYVIPDGIPIVYNNDKFSETPSTSLAMFNSTLKDSAEFGVQTNFIVRNAVTLVVSSENFKFVWNNGTVSIPSTNVQKIITSPMSSSPWYYGRVITSDDENITDGNKFFSLCLTLVGDVPKINWDTSKPLSKNNIKTAFGNCLTNLIITVPK